MGDVLRRIDMGARASHAGALRELPGGRLVRPRRVRKRDDVQVADAQLRRQALDVPGDTLTWLAEVVLHDQARAEAADTLLELMTPGAVADAVDRLVPAAKLAWLRSCGVLVHKKPGDCHVRDGARLLRAELRSGDLDLLRGLLGPALDVALVALGNDDLVHYLAHSGDDGPLLQPAADADESLSWQAEVLQAYDALPAPLRRAALLATVSSAGSPAPSASDVLEAAVASYALACWGGAPGGDLVDAAAYAVGRVEELDAAREPAIPAQRVPDDAHLAELHDVRRERDSLESKAGRLKGELAALRQQVRQATEDGEREARELRRERDAARHQLRETSARLADVEGQDEVLLRLQAEEEADQARQRADALQDECDDLISRLLRAQTQRVCRVAHPELDGEDVADEELPDVVSCADSLDLARRLFPAVELHLATEPVRELDEYGARARPWAGKTLLILGALQDYVEVKRDGFDGDISTYLRNTPAGRRNIPLHWYAAGDSAPRSEQRAARTFPMPYWFNGGEPLYCPAHVRLDAGGRPAPRLHLYDDTGGPSRTVWVAYLGKHLPSGEKV